MERYRVELELNNGVTISRVSNKNLMKGQLAIVYNNGPLKFKNYEIAKVLESNLMDETADDPRPNIWVVDVINDDEFMMRKEFYEKEQNRLQLEARKVSLMQELERLEKALKEK